MVEGLMHWLAISAQAMAAAASAKPPRPKAAGPLPMSTIQPPSGPGFGRVTMPGPLRYAP
jgi:hypothetical protein